MREAVQKDIFPAKVSKVQKNKEYKAENGDVRFTIQLPLPEKLPGFTVKLIMPDNRKPKQTIFQNLSPSDIVNNQIPASVR